MKFLPSFSFLSLCALFFFGCQIAAQEMQWSTSSEAARKAYQKGLRALEFFENQLALEWARKATQADSQFALGYALQARVARRSQRQALVEKFSSLRAKVSAGEKQYLQALAAYFINDRPQAIKMLLALQRKFPHDRQVAMTLGQLQLEEGNYQAAVTALKHANRIDHSTPRADAMLGQCYVMLEDYAQAAAHFRRALEKIDGNATPFMPFFGLAWTHLYEGRAQAALRVEKEYLQRYSRNGASEGFPPVWIWNQIARIQLETGSPEEALESYEAGYKSVPSSALDETQKKIWYGRLLHGKARSLAKMGKINEARKIAEQMKKMIEEGGERGKRFWTSYHYLAGYIELEAGNAAAAAKHLQQANLSDVFHKMLLARAVYQLGEKQHALKLYEEILQSRRNSVERALAYPEAKRMVAQLRSND